MAGASMAGMQRQAGGRRQALLVAAQGCMGGRWGGRGSRAHPAAAGLEPPQRLAPYPWLASLGQLPVPLPPTCYSAPATTPPCPPHPPTHTFCRCDKPASLRRTHAHTARARAVALHPIARNGKGCPDRIPSAAQLPQSARVQRRCARAHAARTHLRLVVVHRLPGRPAADLGHLAHHGRAKVHEGRGGGAGGVGHHQGAPA